MAAIWARHAWLVGYFELDRAALRLKRRDRAPQGAKTVLAQYRHWREAFPGDVVLMQIGAFVERLQWPPRRLRVDAAGGPGESGLRRMRATRRGALEGFPLPRLRRRVAALPTRSSGTGSWPRCRPPPLPSGRRRANRAA